MASKGWIGVDLDGTLAFYDGWKGVEHIGAPINAMVERIHYWLDAGIEVRIFTARVSGMTSDAKLAERYIQDWLEKHGLPRLAVTCRKDFRCIEIWDDRAVQVILNTGTPVHTIAQKG